MLCNPKTSERLDSGKAGWPLSNRLKPRWALFLPLLWFLLLITTLPAWARSWRVADFRTLFSVAEDGNAAVNERITLVFIGDWHGIHRFIPVEYPGPRGTNYSLFLKVMGVTDQDGHNLKYELKRTGPYKDIKIYIPGAADTSRTVQIRYSVNNAIRYFDDHDELYWNVTGNDWPVPIDHASAFVTLPPKAAGSGVRAQAFSGVYGSREKEATSTVNGADAEFESTNPLPMRGGLTIDLFIPKGVLQQPGTLTKLGWFVKSNPIVLLPLASLIVMFVLWWKRGRDPEAGISVAPMYEPPKDMTPAEVGALVDDSIDPRDITSTLIDLAVRGYITIEEKKEKILVFTTKDYVFHLVKPMAEWKDLAPHERVMLENMFQAGSQTSLSGLRNRFYTAIPVIRQDVLAALKKKGMYYVDPDSAHSYWLLGIIIIATPFLLAQWAGAISVFESVPVAIAAIAISAVIVWLFGRQMTAKTFYGVRTRVAILGFEEFMNRVDADRLKRMPPDTFEKYLPYAMALGVEHHWAQAFAGIIKNPPRWYISPDGTMFNPIYFTNSMQSMSSDVHQAFTSAPRSSSGGSGFGGGGGGGFSGGGFGGGGGGAF